MLAGFSQGAAMSLFTGFQYKQTLAGIIALFVLFSSSLA
jgi:predicted esterase